jgi:hypothetical protein
MLRQEAGLHCMPPETNEGSPKPVRAELAITTFSRQGFDQVRRCNIVAAQPFVSRASVVHDSSHSNAPVITVLCRYDIGILPKSFLLRRRRDSYWIVSTPCFRLRPLLTSAPHFSTAKRCTFRPTFTLTAYARSEDRRRAILSGFQVHLVKPVEPMELIAMVASLVGRTGV